MSFLTKKFFYVDTVYDVLYAQKNNNNNKHSESDTYTSHTEDHPPSPSHKKRQYFRYAYMTFSLKRYALQVFKSSQRLIQRYKNS